jgi:hypothetical protein
VSSNFSGSFAKFFEDETRVLSSKSVALKGGGLRGVLSVSWSVVQTWPTFRASTSLSNRTAHECGTDGALSANGELSFLGSLH